MDDLRKRCTEMAVHFSGLSETDCAFLESSPLDLVFSKPESSFCSACTCQKCQVMNTRLYGCSEAYRWNGKYIYYCPLGLVFAASSISDDHGSMFGGLIAGPMVMGDLQDTLSELSEMDMTKSIADLTVLTTAKVNHLAEILAAVTAYASGMPHSPSEPFVYEQEKMLNSFYESKESMQKAQTDPQYFISSEKQLIHLIGSRDKAGAQLLLNELLGHIYFISDFNAVKMRLIELVVQISHATINAGADINEILLFNANSMQKIDKFTEIEELSVWITGIIHRFINYSFNFTQVKHSDAVHKVMEYVKSNYQNKITLDDIAQHVYLSRSYLSSVFKDETGESLFSYINKVRVEKSKPYLLDTEISLLDISGLCGFEDQSYYTKVFKNTVGMSPRTYRNNRGRTPI
ncbi:MAG: AraC family transcriptional regulator [Eubacteriales bacterium]